MKKKIFGGLFVDELKAAEKVNDLCDKYGVEHKNLGLVRNIHKNEKKKHGGTSQYRGVYWVKNSQLWRVEIKFQSQRKVSYHVNELDAAKKANQWCDEFGIKRKNLNIGDSMSNEEVHDYDAIQKEIDEFIKILDENDNPDTRTINKTLTTAMDHDKETTNTEINFQTVNGESALSIAAKHGLSNVVKFLISKGANKEQFTNDHHTPLSLAVNHNHLTVVEVLFEEWISPNSHEKPYLHLLPIFNVKSREFAQLLIDNDAVTNGLYNNKNQSPLTVACQNGFLDVVEFFLDDGLDINHLDSDNKTPLFYAFTNKHHDVVNFLILKGAYN